MWIFLLTGLVVLLLAGTAYFSARRIRVDQILRQGLSVAQERQRQFLGGARDAGGRLAPGPALELTRFLNEMREENDDYLSLSVTDGEGIRYLFAPRHGPERRVLALQETPAMAVALADHSGFLHAKAYNGQRAGFHDGFSTPGIRGMGPGGMGGYGGGGPSRYQHELEDRGEERTRELSQASEELRAESR